MNKDKFLKKDYRVYTTIDGKQCNVERRVGYCWSELHRGYLTKQLMDQHQCIERNCKCFQKYEDAPYWQQKRKSKEKRQNSKNRIKQEKEREEYLLKEFRKITKNDENFFIVNIRKENKKYIVGYISFDFVNAEKYIKKFKEIATEGLSLKQIKTNHQNKLLLVEKIKKENDGM